MLAVIRYETWDVARRLAQFGITRDQMLEVVRACMSAAGNVTDNDPPGSQGWETYRFGVRRLREMLRPDGWQIDNTDGLATIVNHQLKLRIAVANTDEATGVPSPESIPQNRNKKGPTAEQAAQTNVALLPGVEWPRATKPREANFESLKGYVTWHFCIFISGDEVRAELSLVDQLELGFFSRWRERIIILRPGDWKSVDLPSEDEDMSPELDIEVIPR